MFFRSISFQRRILTFAAPVMALLAVGCKGMRDNLDSKLYATADESGWTRDSTLVSSKPAVLFRVFRKGSSQYIFPIALLSKSAPSTLRLTTKRGWGLFDINLLFEGNVVTPVQNGAAGAPLKTLRGMWEIPTIPLDTLPGCTGATLPMGLVSVPASTELVVANYKLPTGMKLLSPGELQDAIRDVPLLVLPTVQISSNQLGEFSRLVRQIPRAGADPAILLEYHNESKLTDTSVVGQRRPKHVVIVLEKGVYGYRPSWVYKTTGKANDLPVLRLLDVLDSDMDGRAEIFFQVKVSPVDSFVLAFREGNDTWTEIWRRSPARCDQ
ncbi:MAG: hypothetical protein ABI120_02590 [Gemmatimonadaceae bacterium]